MNPHATNAQGVHSENVPATADVRRRLWQIGAALLVTLLVATLVMITVSPVYVTNDDMAMRRIASGRYTGTPDAHLVFILYPLGLLISGLYRLDNSWDWYGIVQISLHFGCFLLLFYRLLSRMRRFWSASLAGGLFLLSFWLIWLPHIVFLQFTVTAAILAGTAIIWQATLPDKGGGWLHFGRSAITLLLVLLSLNLRFRMFLAALPFVALIIGQQIMSRPGRARAQPAAPARGNLWRVLNSRKLLLPFAIVLGLGLSWLANNLAYRSPEWQTYQAYNVSRSMIYDYYYFPEYNAHEAFYQSIGVSRESYQAFLTYTLVLEPEPNTAQFTAIARKSRQIMVESLGWSGVLGQSLRFMTERWLDPSFLALSVPVSLCYLVYLGLQIRRRQRIGILAAVGFGLIHLAEWFYLAFNGRLPDRVAWGLFLIEAMTLIALLLAENPFILATRTMNAPYPAAVPAVRPAINQATHAAGEGTDNGLSGPEKPVDRPRQTVWRRIRTVLFQSRTLALLLVLLLFIFQAGQRPDLTDELADYYQEDRIWSDLKSAMLAEPGDFYFLTISYISSYAEAFHWRTDNQYEPFIYLGGWSSFSPHYAAKLAVAGLRDCTSAILGGAGVYVVSMQDVPIDYLLDYFRLTDPQTTYTQVNERPSDNPDNPFVVYRFSANKPDQ